ncbi:Zn-ribbon domain-containing OB-fold protein [Amycolatopsis sp. GM8]|uniref:Zn-ribbon domain-containing OB-fold protein n=1 Tax=Amycolatopsis sp. GM8 TaxID=2896530 RepID=UPI001F429ED3|nr:Zn-ribbon domain-containing OB-fold protein [Amycolatopsis sp. GM8]
MAKLNDTVDVSRGSFRELPFSHPFWEASREKRLLLQQCPRTGQFQFFPRPVSIATGRTDLEWREVDGRGEIYSYTLTHLGPGPFKGQDPYAVIIARLDAGVDIVSNLVHASTEDLCIGRRIRPYWMPLDDGRHLLLFEPDSEVPGK